MCFFGELIAFRFRFHQNIPLFFLRSIHSNYFTLWGWWWHTELRNFRRREIGIKKSIIGLDASPTIERLDFDHWAWKHFFRQSFLSAKPRAKLALRWVLAYAVFARCTRSKSFVTKIFISECQSFELAICFGHQIQKCSRKNLAGTPHSYLTQCSVFWIISLTWLKY